ncbi:hypothetical protein Vau01_091890 [Virgisporangium aurantiacum]|uniref:DUF4229 domain-containing protein n=2 Tax=Virgisporangium aurantiacum TaxID=175570 RepID=A0A8J3ZHT5_9ACTN|nr:hypothetical protein Vau01_091890 [Virgisporangium aurantiacum]
MNPMMKYTIARLGLFIVAAAVLLVVPIELNPFLKLGIALIASAILSFFLLRKLRDDVANQLADGARQRADRKEKLRSALAGDDQD